MSSFRPSELLHFAEYTLNDPRCDVLGFRRTMSRAPRIAATLLLAALAAGCSLPNWTFGSALDGDVGASDVVSESADGTLDDVPNTHDAVDDQDAVVNVTPPPRLIAPLSTATVTSQSPTLHWALAAGTTGAHVEICSDRACAHVQQGLDATAASVQPTSALAAGVHYWHARASNGVTYSPTWEFWVGARSAPIDSSFGTTLDVNGDGFADVIVGASLVSNDTGHVYVYLGSASGLATTAARMLVGPDGVAGMFGAVVASAGDVNGDGFGDIVVSALAVGGFTGRVYVYFGSASGIDTAPSGMVVGADGTNGRFGSSIASAGDVNGDGFADIVVGARGASGNIGRMYVFVGSATGINTVAATRLGSPDGTGAFGNSVSSAGDVNGDGFADVIVGEPGASPGGKAFLFNGSASGLVAVAGTILTGPDGSGGAFGESVSGAADVNGDGFADMIIGAPGVNSNTGRAYVYVGHTTGVAITPTTTLLGPDGMNGYFGLSVAMAGDVNGDGFAEVVVGAPDDTGAVGHAYVFPGGAGGIGTAAASRLAGPDALGGNFGGAVSGAGDVNGDSFADIVVGADLAMSTVGRVHVYSGSATGLAMTPSASLTGPDGANSFFGVSVARAGNVNRCRDGVDPFALSAFVTNNRSSQACVFGIRAMNLAAPLTTMFTSFGRRG